MPERKQHDFEIRDRSLDMLPSLTLQASALVLLLGCPTELWKSVSRGLKCRVVLLRRWLLAPG